MVAVMYHKEQHSLLRTHVIIKYHKLISSYKFQDWSKSPIFFPRHNVHHFVIPIQFPQSFCLTNLAVLHVPDEKDPGFRFQHLAELFQHLLEPTPRCWKTICKHLWTTNMIKYVASCCFFSFLIVKQTTHFWYVCFFPPYLCSFPAQTRWS